MAGLDEDSGGIERLSETLQPVMDVWRLPEAGRLRREALCAGNVAVGAVAAERGRVQLRNPANSGLLVVVRQVYHSGTSSAVYLSLIQTVTDLTTVSQATFQDARWYQPNLSSWPYAVLSSGTTNEAVSNIDSALLMRTARDIFEVQYIIQPGWSFRAKASATNEAILLGLRWTERRALPGELL